MTVTPDFEIPGAFFFGAVVGWMAHRVYEVAPKPGVQWLGGMIGVVGGAAVTALFSGQLFGAYSMGLGLAFFLRVAAAAIARSPTFRHDVRNETPAAGSEPPKPTSEP